MKTLYPLLLVFNKDDSKLFLTRLISLIMFFALWFTPPPTGITVQTWHLFAIFVIAIGSVVIGAFPIFVAAIFAGSATILTGTLTAAKTFSGFANGSLLLIILAFVGARAVLKSRLGERIGQLVVGKLGKSTLGLSYSIFIMDAIIAPAFPSNTARSGVLFPLAVSLNDALGAKPEEEGKRRLGRFLHFSCIASLSLSSALWLTAMAANPAGAALAKSVAGLDITFGSWFIAASIPTFVGIILLPYILYRVIKPEITHTPEAAAQAKRILKEMGPMSRDEIIVATTYTVMIALWALSSTFKIDTAAVAFGGLGIMMASGVLKMEDIAKEGEALGVFIWFALMLALSSQLNELGFMKHFGEVFADSLGGQPWMVSFIALITIYILIHYLFVSQTAQMVALFGVFLGVGVAVGVPAAALAFSLLFATNYFSCITPQGSSANILAVGSGFMTTGEVYKLGALTTLVNFLIYTIIGIPWLLFVTS